MKVKNLPQLHFPFRNRSFIICLLANNEVWGNCIFPSQIFLEVTRMTYPFLVYTTTFFSLSQTLQPARSVEQMKNTAPYQGHLPQSSKYHFTQRLTWRKLPKRWMSTEELHWKCLERLSREQQRRNKKNSRKNLTSHFHLLQASCNKWGFQLGTLRILSLRRFYVSQFQ